MLYSKYKELWFVDSGLTLAALVTNAERNPKKCFYFIVVKKSVVSPAYISPLKNCISPVGNLKCVGFVSHNFLSSDSFAHSVLYQFLDRSSVIYVSSSSPLEPFLSLRSGVILISSGIKEYQLPFAHIAETLSLLKFSLAYGLCRILRIPSVFSRIAYRKRIQFQATPPSFLHSPNLSYKATINRSTSRFYSNLKYSRSLRRLLNMSPPPCNGIVAFNLLSPHSFRFSPDSQIPGLSERCIQWNIKALKSAFQRLPLGVSLFPLFHPIDILESLNNQSASMPVYAKQVLSFADKLGVPVINNDIFAFPTESPVLCYEVLEGLLQPSFLVTYPSSCYFSSGLDQSRKFMISAPTPSLRFNNNVAGIIASVGASQLISFDA
jgi:hypothetical protein